MFLVSAASCGPGHEPSDCTPTSSDYRSSKEIAGYKYCKYIIHSRIAARVKNRNKKTNFLITEIKKDFDCLVSVLHFPAQAGEALDNEVLHLGSWQYLQHNSLSGSVNYLISILFIYFYIFVRFRFPLEYFGSNLQSTSIPLTFFSQKWHKITYCLSCMQNFQTPSQGRDVTRGFSYTSAFEE